MDAILADIFPESRIGYPVIFARFVGAILLGGIIGFEREAKKRPAGLKTHIMVALAAAVFSIISIEAIYTAGMDSDSFKPDPLRVVEAVTAGVAFLAAGTIVLSRGEIHGITTGTSLWLSGAIGLCLGFGHWIIGVAAVVAGIASCPSSVSWSANWASKAVCLSIPMKCRKAIRRSRTKQTILAVNIQTYNNSFPGRTGMR